VVLFLHQKPFNLIHICILIGFIIDSIPPQPRLAIELHGAFLTDHYNDISENYLYVYLQLILTNTALLNSTKITPYSQDRQSGGEVCTNL
jgi:hypothetical protein